MTDHEVLDRIAAHVRDDAAFLVITGAGVSADSGLPTYRGVGGLYDDADTPDGVPIEEAMSGAMLRRRPELTWRYLRQIEEACRGAGPNDAHRGIARLQRRLTRCTVLTQNVDGFHQAAGATDVIAIHGDVHRLFCPQCGWQDRVEDYRELAPLPRCPRCAAVIRPDVVLFGELLPDAAVRALEATMRRGVDVVLSIGTTSVFPYIAGPVDFVVRTGGFAVEINPGDTAVSGRVNARLRLGAADAMRQLWAHLDAEDLRAP
ncbi:MAG: NAD-dependent protein deacylase [Alphaproteobacteria bacterium]|nr:NAD-dependent protein deacylase [Alphaproteobacteria bacterium]